MEIEILDPNQATDEQWQEVYRFTNARFVADWPELTPATFDAFVNRVRTGGIGSEPETLYLMREGGDLVASSYYRIFLDENPHLAILQIGVHPERRRQGIGTAFLREMLAQARRDGRTRVLGPNVKLGGPGAWTARMGFESGLRFAMQRLVVAEVDRGLWEVPVPDGYRLEAWTDAAPEEILESYARARHAIEDAVSGDLTWEDPDWTAEKVRKYEAESLAKGYETRTVVAVHEAGGEVAGVTELALSLTQPERCHQGDTAVVRGHRGHGLGRAMKAAMMRRLVAERPEAAEVTTQTADIQNMARINLEIGYRTLMDYLLVEADVDELEKHLAA